MTNYQDKAELELAAAEKAESELRIFLANAEKTAAEEKKKVDELDELVEQLWDGKAKDTKECFAAEKKRDKARDRWSDAEQQVQMAGNAVRATQQKIYKLAHQCGDKRPDLLAREAAWKQEISKALNRTVPGTAEYREDQKAKAKTYLAEAAKARVDAREAEKRLAEEKVLFEAAVEKAKGEAASVEKKATDKTMQLLRLYDASIQNLQSLITTCSEHAEQSERHAANATLQSTIVSDNTFEAELERARAKTKERNRERRKIEKYNIEHGITDENAVCPYCGYQFHYDDCQAAGRSSFALFRARSYCLSFFSYNP